MPLGLIAGLATSFFQNFTNFISVVKWGNDFSVDVMWNNANAVFSADDFNLLDAVTWRDVIGLAVKLEAHVVDSECTKAFLELVAAASRSNPVVGMLFAEMSDASKAPARAELALTASLSADATWINRSSLFNHSLIGAQAARLTSILWLRLSPEVVSKLKASFGRLIVPTSSPQTLAALLTLPFLNKYDDSCVLVSLELSTQLIRHPVQVLELIISYAVVNTHWIVLQRIFASSTIIAACEAKDAVSHTLAWRSSGSQSKGACLTRFCGTLHRGGCFQIEFLQSCQLPALALLFLLSMLL